MQNQTNQKDIRESRLPNIWILTSQFQEITPQLQYCTEHQTFYYYEDQYWKQLSDQNVNRLFIQWLKKEYKQIYTTFEPRRFKEIKELISSQSMFSMVKSQYELNKDGIIIPFKNGILKI